MLVCHSLWSASFLSRSRCVMHEESGSYNHSNHHHSHHLCRLQREGGDHATNDERARYGIRHPLAPHSWHDLLSLLL